MLRIAICDDDKKLLTLLHKEIERLKTGLQSLLIKVILPV